MRALAPAFLGLLSLPVMLSAQSADPKPIDPFAPENAPSLPVASPDARPDAGAIVQKLTAAKAAFALKQKEIATAALGRYMTGAQSEAAAAELYATCMGMVQSRVPDLDGVTKKDAKEQQDRLKDAQDHAENTPGRAALLQLQLQYLVFTMEASKMKDHGAVVMRLKDFGNRAMQILHTVLAEPEAPQRKVVASVSGKGSNRREQEQQRTEREQQRLRQELLQTARTTVMGSIFAQAFNLSNYFQPPAGWPAGPLDIDVIYNGHIFPYRYETKPELLASEWDDYLKLSMGVARLSNDDRGYARWLVGGYKALQWKRAMDLLHHSTNRTAAADELVNLIKDNPTHPSVGNWVTELDSAIEEVLNPKPSTPPDDAATSGQPPAPAKP